jgi:hypothetical protein
MSRRWLTCRIPALILAAVTSGCYVKEHPIPRGITISREDRARCEAFADHDVERAKSNVKPVDWLSEEQPLVPGAPPLVAPNPMMPSPRYYLSARFKTAWTTCIEPIVLAQTSGPEHRDVARSYAFLAGRYAWLGEDAEAERLYQRALAIQAKALGPEHPDMAGMLEDYASLLRRGGRQTEADGLAAHARAIRAKAEAAPGTPQDSGKP